MKAWRTVMDEWEQTAKQFKSNAEFLESLCQDKLTHLYQDKRKARKTYQEEHHKIASQFTNVSQSALAINYLYHYNTTHTTTYVLSYINMNLITINRLPQ